MSQPKILITGASGKTGLASATALLQQGFSVRALVRRHDERASYLRDAGAEVVIGNLEDLSQLHDAMRGVQRAYFVCPWTPNQLDMAMNFAVAAADNRLEHVVTLSQWLSHPAHPSMATRRTYLSDRILGWLPETSWTVINVGFFADNYMALLETIAQLGMLPMPLGEGRNAPVSNEDIGRTVAGALAAPEEHSGRIYRPTGPALLAPREIAEVFGRVLGRRVRYQNISPHMFLKATRSMGMPTGLISQLDHYFAEYRLGTFEVGAPNDAVLHVTGREPEDFETIVSRYVAGQQVTGLVPASGHVDTGRTLGNWARAMAGFLRLLLTRAPNLDRHERAQEYPTIDDSHYSIATKSWSKLHDKPNAFGSQPDNQLSGTDISPIRSRDGNSSATLIAKSA